MSPYYSIDEMTAVVDEPYRSICFRILCDHRELFQKARGSKRHHQAWPGGYFDHVREIMNIVIILFERLSVARPLPFSLSDALLVAFLHDIEKPWKYELDVVGNLQYVEALATKERSMSFARRSFWNTACSLRQSRRMGLSLLKARFVITPASVV